MAFTERLEFPTHIFYVRLIWTQKSAEGFCAQMQRRCANEALEQKDSSEYEGKLKANSLSSLRRCYFTDNTQIGYNTLK